MKTYCSFLLLLLVVINCSSQSSFIYFNKNSYSILQSEIPKLDVFYKQTNKNSIKIIGYADTVGNDVLNNKLAKNRALAIKHFFVGKGFLPSNILIEIAGETNSEEAFLALNRRVEVSAPNNFITSVIDFKKEIAPSNQVFVLTKGINVIKCRGGITVTLNKDNLEFENGISAQNEEIKLNVTEYLNYADFFSQNLFTLSNGRPLESKGMAYISATANGKKLRMKKGTSYSLTLPTKKEEGFKTYYGVKSKGGIVNWVLPNENLIKDKNNFEGLDDSLKLYNLTAGIENGRLEPKMEQKINYDNLTNRLNADSIGIIFMNNTLEVVNEKTSKEHQKTKSIKAAMPNNDMGDDSLRQPVVVNRNFGPTTEMLEVVYETLNVTGFGWINCDRVIVSDVSVNCNIKLKVNGVKDFSAVVIYEKIKGMLPIFSNQDFGSILSIMPNEPVFLVVVGSKKDSMFFYYEKINPLEKNIVRDIALEPIAKEELKSFLALIGK